MCNMASNIRYHVTFYIYLSSFIDYYVFYVKITLYLFLTKKIGDV